jgi:hypothetical protein
MKIVMTSLLLLAAHLLQAQGCSDAGFCGIVRSQSNTFSSQKNRLELAYVFAKGEADVTIHTQQLSYLRTLGSRWAVGFRGTFATAQGTFGLRGFPGDVYGTAFYKLTSPDSAAKKLRWNALGGLKAPFNLANLKINDHPLPMVYQSSLGTGDVILGVNVDHARWMLDAAFQVPLLNLNRNGFIAEQSGTREFPTTNLFRRQPDVLLRATWKYTSRNDKLHLRPNLMAIAHLGNDTFEDATGQRQTIENSAGLTVNWNLLATYYLNAHHGIEASLAAPIVAREARPDGLTRAFTAGLSYIARW